MLHAILRLFPQIKFTKNNSLQTMMKLLKYLYNDHHTTQSTINKVLVFQGDDMLHEIYYNIGVVEVCKAFYIQIAFTKFILKLQFNTKC